MNFPNDTIETKQQFNLSFEIVKKKEKKDDNTSNFTEIYVHSFSLFLNTPSTSQYEQYRLRFVAGKTSKVTKRYQRRYEYRA